MTIPALQLDDLTWSQMMEAIRERIPAASDSQWTLHAPVDPGITLLELYAWLLEQRLYLLDQVPDELVRGVLALLGIPGPAPVVPAATVLALNSTPPTAVSAVPAGTELVRDLGAQRIVFTTEDAVALVPPGPWRLLTGGVDRTADLPTYGVELLGSPSSSPVELVLSVPEGLDPPADAWLALLLDLDSGPRIPPSWSPDAVDDVPPPAVIAWSYETTPGHFEAFSSHELDDGTGGLRRSGVVRLTWPDPWRPGAGTAAGSATVERRLRLSASQATFSAPPRLLHLALNAVVARHRQRVTAEGASLGRLEDQLDGWLSLPGQSLDLDAAQPTPGTVVGRLTDDPATVQLALTERDGARHSWAAVSDLSTHSPDDRVFEIDRAAGRLRFGDGLTGRLPVVAPRRPGDPPRLRLSYELGGGEEGNLGIVSWSCSTLPIKAISAVPARFGQPPETIEHSRTRAAGELARPTRAVTASDIKQIALNTPGVDIARAHVAVGLHPATPCDLVAGAVTVVIVPGVTGDRSEGRPSVSAPMPDPGVIAAVRAALEAARLIGTEVFVRGPRYHAVRLSVALGSAVADRARLQQRLEDGLRLHLDPLAGGPKGDGWIFGEPLRPAELLGVAQRLAGQSAVIDGVSIGLDGAAADEACQDVAIAAQDLVLLAGLTLTGPRAAAASGTSGPGGLS